nr:MAG TPA: hypothetical protein [Caudoviricetes sp.]
MENDLKNYLLGVFLLLLAQKRCSNYRPYLNIMPGYIKGLKFFTFIKR